MRSIPLTLALGAAVLLGGCVVGPKYKSPAANAPPAFRGQEGAAQPASIADLPWWEVFQDQTLQGLVRTAIANNYDLRIAVRRVEQARELSVQARSQYYPGAGYEVQTSRGKNEAFGAPNLTYGKTAAAGMVGLGATWELDLWGRIRHMNESALAAYLASDYARRGVILSLTTGVASRRFVAVWASSSSGWKVAPRPAWRPRAPRAPWRPPRPRFRKSSARSRSKRMKFGFC